MIILYGIPNCETVKKARAWLTARGLQYVFHDFKKQGVPVDRLEAWIQAVGVDKLINRQGTTWRKLDTDSQASASAGSGALTLMQTSSSVIKRPVVEWQGSGGAVTAGFDAEKWLLLARPKSAVLS